MTDSVERLVNLAMLLASAAGPVTAEQARAEVAGYPPDQDEATFLRMFERDKDMLRESGLAITSTADGRYVLDAEQTFAGPLDLSPEEAVTLRTVAGALASDDAFPFSADLRYAIAKIADASANTPPATTMLAEESPAKQGTNVERFAGAMTRRKRVEFLYTNAAGSTAPHTVEPYGVFVREGRWYVIGRDTERNEPRVFAAMRMTELAINEARPKTPDYEVPSDFSVSSYIGLPFQYGSEDVEAKLRLDGPAAARIRSLAAGVGHLAAEGSGFMWTVAVRDSSRLLAWVVENGPGITIVEPSSLTEVLIAGLEKARALHG